VTDWFGSSADIHEQKTAQVMLERLASNLESEVALRTEERDRTWQLSQDLLSIWDSKGGC
jgi:hypothetical protein